MLEQYDLARYVHRSYRCTPYELLLSGPGLERMYDLLQERAGKPPPDWLLERMKQMDRATVISEVAPERRDPVCDQARDLFVAVLAEEESNAALKFLALGGCLPVWGDSAEDSPEVT